MTRALNRWCALLALLAGAAQAQNVGPRIAVTELAYQRQVSEYFEVSEERRKAAVHAGTHHLAAAAQYASTKVSGTHSYIEQGELRNFTADLKGLILKGGGARLVQGRGFDAGAPQSSKAEQVLAQVQTGRMAKAQRQPDVNDIVSRIRKGEFAGADYVLFGSVSSVEFTNQLSPLQGTTTTTSLFGLDIAAEFSLINTRTYEIKAAFGAQGSGSETKMLSARGDVVQPNRAKVIREAATTLAEDAYGQMLEQLGLVDPNFGRRARSGRGGDINAPAVAPRPPEPVTVYR